jgi:Ras-related protein Rab-32
MDYYCQDNGFDKWFETSAKENTNIEKAIQYLTDEVIN